MKNVNYSIFIGQQTIEILQSEINSLKDEHSNQLAVAYAEKRASCLSDMLKGYDQDFSSFFSSAHNILTYINDDQFMLNDLKAEVRRLSYEN